MIKIIVCHCDAIFRYRSWNASRFFVN